MTPAKVPVNMHRFATWLEDYVTSLTAAGDAGAHVELQREMSILTHVGKPLQAQNSLFMTEWVAIFRESRLRDDLTVHRLQDACLKLVVSARARARELQVDFQVEKANKAIVAISATPNFYTDCFQGQSDF